MNICARPGRFGGWSRGAGWIRAIGTPYPLFQGVDERIDGVDRELGTAIDIRERLATLEARRAS